MSDVQGVMVTHIHPDHYGLAGHVRENSDAWIALHPADAALIHDRYEEPTDLLERMGGMLRKLGAPASELEELRNASMPARPFVDFVEPDVLMEDGDKPRHARAGTSPPLWTPGHSPGHLCFWEATHRLMLTGDCVLPAYHPQRQPQPADRARSRWATTSSRWRSWRRSTPSRRCPPTSGATSATAPACSRSAPTTSSGSSR